jgi:hypothetical protein
LTKNKTPKAILSRITKNDFFIEQNVHGTFGVMPDAGDDCQ